MKLIYYIFVVCSLIAMGCGSSKPTTSANASSSKKKLSATYFDANKARLANETTKAKEGYLAAIKEDPGNASAYYYYGKMKMVDKAFDDALPFAKKAFELNADNKFYKELYADALASGGNYKKAITLYKELAKSDSKLAEKYLRYAVYYEYQAGQYDNALQTFDELEKYYGVDDDLVKNKINILRKQKKYDDIVKEADKLIVENPNNVNNYLLKIDALEDAKQLSKAQELKLFVEDKFSDNASLISVNTLKALTAHDTAKYFILLQKAMDSKELESDEKIALVLPVLQMSVNDSTMQKKLLSYGKKIVEVAPEDEKAIGFYAAVLYNARQNDNALVQYNKLLNKNPGNFDTWQQVMFIYANQQNNDSLISISKRAMELFPNQALVYLMNGIGHQQKENYFAAVKSLNRALDYAEGNKDLESQVLTTLGDLYNAQKNYAYSDSCFDRALRVDPEDATTLNNYAYFLSVRNIKLDQAEKMSRKSLAIRKGEKSFLDTYAWILYKQGKLEDAKKTMQEALDADGENDAAMLEHYGDILYKSGDKAKAKSYWQQAKTKGSKAELLDKKIANGELYE